MINIKDNNIHIICQLRIKYQYDKKMINKNLQIKSYLMVKYPILHLYKNKIKAKVAAITI